MPSTSAVAGVFEHAGSLTAVARNWRATFDGDGVRFQPALGRDAPTAHTFAIHLERVSRGATVWLDADAATPRREHDRRRVTLFRPGFAEHFTARPEGLEHSFTLAARPAGRGDLTIALRITTDLRPDADGDHWRDGDGLGVDLGPVVAITADGRRFAGSKRRTNTGIELLVPANVIDRACYPLEIDPLISTATQAYAGTDNDYPDVAYDAASDSWCVVWTQFLGGGQTGVVGSVWSATPLAFAYAFSLNQNGDEDEIRVTNIAGVGVFVLAWTNHEPAGNWISGLALDPVQAQASNIFPIDGPFAVSNPVLSGEATVLDDDCLVAWLDDSLGLLGCTVTIDAQLQATLSPITQIATGQVEEPAISKQGGADGRHLITWTNRPVGQPGWIRAQLVDHDMNLLGPAAWVRDAPQNAGFSAVDGDGFKFLVAWEEQELQNPSTTDVRGRVLTVGPTGITSVGGVLELRAAPGLIDYAADVCLLGDKFGLAYMVADPTAIYDDDAFVRVLDPAGAPIGPELQLDVTPGINYPYEHAPRLIGRRDGDPATTADDGLVVFADQNTSATFDSDVGLQAVEAMGNGGAVVDLGGGCGPGGLAVCPGPVALGNQALPLELYGAQPLAVPFVLLGMPNMRVSCGVCAFVDPTAAWFVPNTAGTALTAFAIPGDPVLVGFAFDMQFVSFNVLYVGCPLLPGVATSNIVRCTVDV
ncbi:MAG TPA: hypothetical protein ENI87_00585 [bacterium]|nr:hypothetical protein [bacterium]